MSRKRSGRTRLHVLVDIDDIYLYKRICSWGKWHPFYLYPPYLLLIQFQTHKINGSVNSTFKVIRFTHCSIKLFSRFVVLLPNKKKFPIIIVHIYLDTFLEYSDRHFYFLGQQILIQSDDTYNF